MTSFLGLNASVSSPFTLTQYAVGANGVFSLALGLAALVNPLLFLGAFDLQPHVTTPETKKVARDLLVVYAARDLALGFAITSAAWFGHREIMGWSMVGVAVIAALDGTVSWGNVVGGQWKHWFFVGTSAGIAGACFGFV